MTFSEALYTIPTEADALVGSTANWTLDATLVAASLLFLAVIGRALVYAYARAVSEAPFEGLAVFVALCKVVYGSLSRKDESTSVVFPTALSAPVF